MMSSSLSSSPVVAGFRKSRRRGLVFGSEAIILEILVVPTAAVFGLCGF